MKKISRRGFLALCAAAGAAGLLAGCGDTEAAASSTVAAPTATPEPEQVTVRAGYMPNYASLWAVATAIGMGCFESRQLDCQLVEYESGLRIVDALEAGELDVGYLGEGGHLQCINGRAQVFLLTQISNADALIGGPGITTVEDLRGQAVLYTPGTSSETILQASLARYGMTMADIQPVAMEAAEIPAAMAAGQGAACAVWSPYSLAVLDASAANTKLTDNTTFADTTVSLGSWVATAAYCNDRATVVERFTRAMYEAMDYAADGHYDEVARYIAGATGADYAAMYAQRGDADWFTGEEVAAGAADGTVENYYQLQRDGYVAAGMVTQQPPPAVADYVLLDNMVNAGA